jgi:hypothetical protein
LYSRYIEKFVTLGDVLGHGETKKSGKKKHNKRGNVGDPGVDRKIMFK